MQIRDLERPLLTRTRAKNEDPLRKTARELGLFLDRLTVAVRDAVGDEDTVDDSISDKSRNAAFRRFKTHSPAAEEAPPLSVNLDTDQEEALTLLREARGLAADAGMRTLPLEERINWQARFDDIFRDLGTRRIATLLSLSDTGLPDGIAPFSLDTPETSHQAYRGVEELIIKIYELGPRDENTGAAISSQHETALNAAEKISEFLLNEGPAGAFARFREINRSNVLGLLK